MARQQNRHALSSPTGEPIPPRTEAEYQLECLRRCSSLQRSVLEFHQKWPPVWVVRDGLTPVGDLPTLRARNWREQPRRRRQLRQDYPRQPLPVERSGDGRVLIGRPQTLEDLEMLDGFAVQHALTRYRRLRLDDGDAYFTASGSGSQQEWEADFETLAARWPTVPRSCLRWPWTPLRPRPLLLAPSQSMPAGAVGAVSVVICRYQEMTAADHKEACGAILKLLRLHAGKGKRRAQPSKWAKRLRIFDAYTRLRSYSAVSKELRLPESTARRLYAQAFLDIEGTPLEGTSKKRRLAGIDLEQFHSCQRCFTDPKGPCPSHRVAWEAYIGQDHVARPPASTMKALRAHLEALK